MINVLIQSQIKICIYVVSIIIHYVQFHITGIVSRESDSLFTYRESGNFDMFYDPTFTPIFTPNFTNPELESEAEGICGNDVACLFDVAATGSVDVGLSTLSGSRELQEFRDFSLPSENIDVQVIIHNVTTYINYVTVSCSHYYGMYC